MPKKVTELKTVKIKIHNAALNLLRGPRWMVSEVGGTQVDIPEKELKYVLDTEKRFKKSQEILLKYLKQAE